MSNANRVSRSGVRMLERIDRIGFCCDPRDVCAKDHDAIFDALARRGLVDRLTETLTDKGRGELVKRGLAA